MTVIKNYGFTTPGGHLPLNHARIGHARNWQEGGTITASGTATGYFADAPDNSLTYERWKPDGLVSTWEHAFAGLPSIDYCGIAGHTLGTDQVEVTAQYRGDERTNVATLSEFPGLWTQSAGTWVIPNSELDSAGRAVMSTVASIESGTFHNVQRPVSLTVQNTYAVYSVEVRRPSRVAPEAAANTVTLRINGVDLGAPLGTNSTIEFNFDTETVSHKSGAEPNAAGFVKLSDTHYRVWLAITGVSVSTVLVYPNFSAFTIKTACCFGNAQLEDSLVPSPSSYIPSPPSFTSRPGTATYMDETGQLQTAAVDELRLHHVIRDGQLVQAGSLLELGLWQYFSYSEDFSQAIWTKLNCSVTPGAIPAPDGTVTGTLMKPTTDYVTGEAYLDILHTLLTVNTTVALSVFVKKHKSSIVALALVDQANTLDQYAYFDLDAGTVLETTGPATAYIEEWGNGWWRIVLLCLSDTADLNVRFRIGVVEAAGVSTVYRGGNEGVYVWGANMTETGRRLSSYTKTTGSALFRASDVYGTAVAVSEWHDLAHPKVPADDSPIMILGTPVTTPAMRLRLRGNVAPELSVAKFGEALQMERPFYGGHSPIDFARNVVYKTNMSVSGEFLGKSRKSVSLTGAFEWKNLTYEWVRENWTEMQLAAETDAFFLAWRPDNYQHVGYLEAEATAVPSAQGVRDWFTVTLNAKGLGYV